MLTIEEVSRILGVGVHTTKCWADEGRINFKLKDGDYYFEKSAVDAFTTETGIKLIKPEDFNNGIKNIIVSNSSDVLEHISHLVDKHLSDKNLMTPEDIKELFEKNK